MNARNSLKIFLLYLGLLAAAGVAITWIGRIQFGALSPSFVSRSIWLVIALGLGWAVYDTRVRLPEVVRANPFFWALLGLAALSVLWSVAPMVSAKHVAVLAVMFLIGVALARTVSLEAGVGVLQVAFATMVLVSALVAWYVPEIGIHGRWVGAPWKGLFGQKNWLGNAAALWGILCLALALSSRRLSGVLGALAGIVVAVLVMWKSDSVTSYFGFAAGVAVLLALYSVQRGWFKAWHLAVLAGVALVLSAVLYTELFRLFGRNETLTGRWSMWQTLWPIMLERPLLGYGYDAYLYADGVVEGLGRWKNMLAGGGNVHNGFIRLQLDIGLVGVLLGVGMFVHLFWRLVGWIRRGEIDRPRYIAAGMWTVIFLHQIAEPSMFLPISLSVVLLVYTSLISYTPSEPRPA
jgi:O-antigen ligase